MSVAACGPMMWAAEDQAASPASTITLANDVVSTNAQPYAVPA